MGASEKPIEIGRLQRFAMETYYDAGGKLPLRKREERSERVACIGAGPASLACAAELRQQGFQVTVIDKRALPGGLNTYGVAEYKLRTADSLREVEMIRGLGVEFETRDVDAAGWSELEREFDAVFLGVGLGAMHRLAVEGGGELVGGDRCAGVYCRVQDGRAAERGAARGGDRRGEYGDRCGVRGEAAGRGEGDHSVPAAAGDISRRSTLSMTMRCARAWSSAGGRCRRRSTATADGIALTCVAMAQDASGSAGAGGGVGVYD